MFEACIRGLAVEPEPYHGSQLFYVISNTLNFDQLQPLDQNARTWPQACGEQERLWQVRTTVREVVRAVAVPTLPLGPDAILSGGTPRSYLVARITTSHPKSNDSYLLDMGQTFEVYARDVTVEVMTSRGFQLVSGAAEIAPIQGVIADALVTVSAEKIEESRGSRLALYTQLLWIREGSTELGVIPAGARSLTVSSSPAATNRMRFFRGVPSLGMLTSIVSLSSGAKLDDLSNASHWEVDAGAERALTLTWGIQA